VPLIEATTFRSSVHILGDADQYMAAGEKAAPWHAPYSRCRGFDSGLLGGNHVK